MVAAQALQQPEPPIDPIQADSSNLINQVYALSYVLTNISINFMKLFHCYKFFWQDFRQQDIDSSSQLLSQLSGTTMLSQMMGEVSVTETCF
jgi:uncharacterized membrane protein